MSSTASKKKIPFRSLLPRMHHINFHLLSESIVQTWFTTIVMWTLSGWMCLLWPHTYINRSYAEWQLSQQCRISWWILEQSNDFSMLVLTNSLCSHFFISLALALALALTQFNTIHYYDGSCELIQNARRSIHTCVCICVCICAHCTHCTLYNVCWDVKTLGEDGTTMTKQYDNG